MAFIDWLIDWNSTYCLFISKTRLHPWKKHKISPISFVDFQYCCVDSNTILNTKRKPNYFVKGSRLQERGKKNAEYYIGDYSCCNNNFAYVAAILKLVLTGLVQYETLIHFTWLDKDKLWGNLFQSVKAELWFSRQGRWSLT